MNDHPACPLLLVADIKLTHHIVGSLSKMMSRMMMIMMVITVTIVVKMKMMVLKMTSSLRTT